MCALARAQRAGQKHQGPPHQWPSEGGETALALITDNCAWGLEVVDRPRFRKLELKSDPGGFMVIPRAFKSGGWRKEKRAPKKLVGKCDGIFTWNCYIFFVNCRNIIGYLQGVDVFERSEWISFNDKAAGVVRVGYKTGQTTLFRIDGVRPSEAKGAQKS